MNVVEFIWESGLFSSKGEIKRLIKNNGLSLDGVKCKLDDTVFDFELINTMHISDFITDHDRQRDDEKIMFNCLKKFGRSNFKKHELLGVALRDMFVFSEGKHKHFILICNG